jgi:hypothetical protein
MEKTSFSKILLIDAGPVFKNGIFFKIKNQGFQVEIMNLSSFLSNTNHIKDSLLLIPDILVDIIDINLDQAGEQDPLDVILLEKLNRNSFFQPENLNIVDTIKIHSGPKKINEILRKYVKNDENTVDKA